MVILKILEDIFKMNKDYIKILKACAEEPGIAEAIVNESGLGLETVKKALIELEKKGLVYKGEEEIGETKDYLWAATLEGDKFLDSL